uniref:Opsin 6 n=1 Tax=Euphausia superba TaxID=6819 RepID=A0A142BLT1_EUPSU|nr:opsin 6 [Euphausia superba]
MGYWGLNFQIPTPSLQSTNPYGNYTVVDIVTPDMLHRIDPHWYQFPPMNPMWYGILGFVISIALILSLFGNGVVIYVFVTTKNLRTPANFLIVNLAVADFCMMTSVSFPMIVNCVFRTWVLGPFICDIYGMCGSLFGCVAIYSMMFITYDRYNVIVKGITNKPPTYKGSFAKITFSWIWCTGWCIAPILGWNRYVPEGNMTVCGTDYLSKDWLSQSYLYAYGAIVYFCPLLYVLWAYTYIVSSVAAHEKNMRLQAEKMGMKSLRTEESQKMSVEFRLARIALMTVALWFIAWTPYCVINFVGMNAKHYITPLFSVWGSLFSKLNAIYNPIVYAISHPKYRAALYTKMPWLSCSTDEESDVGGDRTTIVTNSSIIPKSTNT